MYASSPQAASLHSPSTQAHRYIKPLMQELGGTYILSSIILITLAQSSFNLYFLLPMTEMLPSGERQDNFQAIFYDLDQLVLLLLIYSSIKEQRIEIFPIYLYCP